MRLYREGKVSPEEAYLRAVDKKTFEVAFGWSAEAPARPTGLSHNTPNGRAAPGSAPEA